MKRFGVLLASAALATSGPALAFRGGGGGHMGGFGGGHFGGFGGGHFGGFGGGVCLRAGAWPWVAIIAASAIIAALIPASAIPASADLAASVISTTALASFLGWPAGLGRVSLGTGLWGLLLGRCLLGRCILRIWLPRLRLWLRLSLLVTPNPAAYVPARLS